MLTVHVPEEHSDGTSDSRRSLAPPRGLKPESVRPLLQDSDPRIGAHAGYLLTLFGEAEGLPFLLRYWREHPEERSDIEKPVYRAIAALNDATKIGVLKEIYGRLREYEVSDFYWTIRVMTGPEILRVRTQIREDVGMERLGQGP